MSSISALARPPVDVERELDLRARRSTATAATGLDRMRALLDLLGAPEEDLRAVHVTGTNGKSTTTHMADALLRASGLRVGRFTSPHLHSLRERIAFDGAPISAAGLRRAYDAVQGAVSEVDARFEAPVTVFEVLTAMAFWSFAEARVDAAVMEVGIGGRRDATNVADGEVAVITPIDLDHVERLGRDRAAIASEKAGIIKRGATAVIAEQAPSAMAVIEARAHAVDATVLRAGRDIRVRRRRPTPTGQRLTLEVGGVDGRLRDIAIPLYGPGNAGNALVAVAAAEAFLRRRERSLSSADIRRTLSTVSLAGHLEVVERDPLVIIDAAHNPSGVRACAQALRETWPGRSFVTVLAVSGDKDFAGMVRALDGVASRIIASTYASPRALDVDTLSRAVAEILGPDRVQSEPDLARAIVTARHAGAPARDGVLITGSVMTAGEARACLRISPAAEQPS